MTEHSSWKFAQWPELSTAVEGWTAEDWGWKLEAVTKSLNDLGWFERKTARDMLLFTTTLSPETEAVLRLDNADKPLIRSIALVVTTVVTAHESNTTKAKAFLAESFAETAASLATVLGESAESDESEMHWNVSQGHIALVLTRRSVRLTFYSAAGLAQATAAANSRDAMAGQEKKKKAPAPWRVATATPDGAPSPD